MTVIIYCTSVTNGHNDITTNTAMLRSPKKLSVLREFPDSITRDTRKLRICLPKVFSEVSFVDSDIKVVSEI